MAALIQTIAVMDKSGKAISSSKHLVNVYKEAKAAYRERKAEVAAGRRYEIEEQKTRKALKEGATTFDGNRPAAGTRRHSRSHHGSSHRPSSERRDSGKSPQCDSDTKSASSHRRRQPRDVQSPHSPRPPTSQPEILPRRHSDELDIFRRPKPLLRSMTSPISPPSAHIDMDLCYGPIPPPLPVARATDEAEFKGLVRKVRTILEEADCLHYSATAIIASLQKNPDAMAAVALTLAELSAVVKKVAPGLLTAMRNTSPTVFSLLASPQFLIAGGVAVGVTIVAFGGYKIVKKIQANNTAATQERSMDEMIEIGGDVGRIHEWRRGIAEVEEQSVGTSVDGEFITPRAVALSTAAVDVRDGSDIKKKDAAGSETRGDRSHISGGDNTKKSGRGGTSANASSRKSRSESSNGNSNNNTNTQRRSTSETGSSKQSSSSPKPEPKPKSKSRSKEKPEKEKEKKSKKPSPLRLMFS